MSNGFLTLYPLSKSLAIKGPLSKVKFLRISVTHKALEKALEAEKAKPDQYGWGLDENTISLVSS